MITNVIGMEQNTDRPDLKKMGLGLIVGSVILAVILYAGYVYSQKNGGRLILPRGTFTGKNEDKPGFNTENPPTAPLRFTAGSDVQWMVLKGKTYPYAFSYPQTLSLSVFPNDPSDSVAINWGNINPSFNILLNIEKITDRGQEYAGKPEEYARNWWKAFSGLKGVVAVDKFTNTNGLTGYKAVYLNSLNQSPNVDVFLVMPYDQNLVIHLANGVLDPGIFNRIVDSVKYSPKATPTQQTSQ